MLPNASRYAILAGFCLSRHPTVAFQADRAMPQNVTGCCHSAMNALRNQCTSKHWQIHSRVSRACARSSAAICRGKKSRPFLFWATRVSECCRASPIFPSLSCSKFSVFWSRPASRPYTCALPLVFARRGGKQHLCPNFGTSVHSSAFHNVQI